MRQNILEENYFPTLPARREHRIAGQNFGPENTKPLGSIQGQWKTSLVSALQEFVFSASSISYWFRDKESEKGLSFMVAAWLAIGVVAALPSQSSWKAMKVRYMAGKTFSSHGGALYYCIRKIELRNLMRLRFAGRIFVHSMKGE